MSVMEMGRQLMELEGRGPRPWLMSFVDKCASPPEDHVQGWK